jgi:hypothetical protein
VISGIIPYILQVTAILDLLRYARDSCTWGDHKFSTPVTLQPH